jgi:phosphate transport system protein
MQRQLDSGLTELKQSLVAMAGYVERAIESAIQAWRARNVEKTAQVYQIEMKVNESHIAIDAACLKLLATQQPLAGDLRLILAVIKMNNDLERMVDQAVNIARNSEYYLKDSPLIQLIDLSKMADEVKVMVRQAIDAFVRSDEALAHDVLEMDDKVDAFKNKVFADVLEYVKQNPAAIEQGLNIILIARNLERIGDHATNIAEDVIFTISGRDVRHTPRVVKDVVKGGGTSES